MIEVQALPTLPMQYYLVNLTYSLREEEFIRATSPPESCGCRSCNGACRPPYKRHTVPVLLQERPSSERREL